MLMQNHRIENAERIVGFPFVLLGEYGGTVFVADEQFIVGRQKCNAVLLHFAISITLVQEIFRTVYHFTVSAEDICSIPIRHSFTGNPLHHTKSASVAGAWLWKYFVAKRANASSFGRQPNLFSSFP